MLVCAMLPNVYILRDPRSHSEAASFRAVDWNYCSQVLKKLPSAPFSPAG